MLFNYNNNGSDELRSILGTYYASNDFDIIAPFIKIEERKIRDLIGQDLFDRIHDFYNSQSSGSGSSSTENQESTTINQQLLDLVRYPVAVFAQLRHGQSNLVSHEDTGRKVKIDPENEKMPWEWMLDRDDSAQMHLGFEALENLFEFLDDNINDISEWKSSNAWKKSQYLFITDAVQFDEIYPIDKSRRFYYSVSSLMAEVERKTIRPAIGNLYFELKDEMQSSGGISDEHSDLYYLVCDAIPLHTMILAAQRFNIQIMPEGVTQRILSESESRNAATNASADVLDAYINHLQPIADDAINDIKKFILATDPEANDYPIKPNNSPDNKFFRT